jgi:hypothetical protein
VPAPERFRLIHIVAKDLDAAVWPSDAIVLRIAPDEVLALSSAPPEISDPHAIVLLDDGFVGVWLGAEVVERFCEWETPRHRPAFAQGAVAGLPAKVWFERDRVLVLVPASYAADLEERIA